MRDAKLPVARTDELVQQNVDNEVLVYDLRSDKAFCLNDTSAKVWKLCDGTRDIPAITNELGNKSSDDAVWLALDQLKQHGLLLSNYEADPRFDGVSRRNVIKKIGLASAIAIPAVFSLVAPSSVFALSCGDSGASCGSPATCCSNVCFGSQCICGCVNPGDCLTQTLCPSTVNCNMNGICAP
jgi:hypothetical protein